MSFLRVSAILCIICCITSGYIDDVLKRYDFVYPSSAKRRIVKRGAGNADGSLYNRIEELEFSALKRRFRLFLTPKRGLFAPKFQLAVSDGSGLVKYLHVDPDEFMEGHVFGEVVSKVSANIDENGAINAIIQFADETYTVEPAWRYLQHLPLNVSIIYRHSDLRLEEDNQKQPICAGAFSGANERLGNVMDYWLYGQNGTSTGGTKKRRSVEQHVHSSEKSTIPTPQVLTKNRCPVKLVADFRFFEHIGRKKASLTSRYLINLIDRVNSIYSSTVWRDSEQEAGIFNMGFVIKKILIHSSPTKELDHYNSNTSDWPTVDGLLQKFSEAEGSKNYCLVHLFTYQSFPNGVLGLGYIASAKEGSPGGICSAPMYDKRRYIYYNTALSSAKSSSGGPVVTREADIVTAHEFGHNWGSLHDSASAECSPSQKFGGSYIMYTYSVSGYDENNKHFSPCSKRSIKAVLETKSHLCFQEEEASFCGNQKVEAGEECDEGLLGDPDGGRCCTSDCKLKLNAKCSPKNSLCCSTDCQFERAGTVCRDSDSNRCLMEARCDGQKADCPSSERLQDGTECLDKGECQRGVCVSFCEKRNIGMKPCICENVTQTCYRCCRQSNTSECVPYLGASLGGLPIVASDGTRCIQGYCQRGRCVQKAADFVQHLWHIIDKLDINSFWRFLSDNIVATIIAASLVVWIPASCVVHRWDERTRREKQERQENLDYIVTNFLTTPSDHVTVIDGVKSIWGRNRDNPPAVAV